MSDLQRLRRYSYQGEGDEIAELVNDIHWAADEIERLTALTEADRKEIGSYREGTGLRGEWKAMTERIAELEAELKEAYAEIRKINEREGFKDE